MLIRSFWYGTEDSVYARLARVLELSALRYHTAVITHGPELPTDRSEAFILKARDWTRAISQADGPLVLLDCDMYVRGDLSHLFKQDTFDLAVTRDSRGRLNSGALFIRPTDRVRAFFAPWEEHTRKWCKKNTPDKIGYGDQDALARMLATNESIRTRNLPMKVYNSTQRTWPGGIDNARIVHVKSDARKHIERGIALTTPGAEHVVAEWFALESAIV